ncbi:hypothetical protein BB560_005611 [Smittium megazygosporum]|uniref:ATP synthase F(0) complex subunit e, mitochondrial n=1 Tax=Smittium megazygosporum TaxID=133381 RepID=A0A2T9Z2E7_9FUNG|nr:hypothetical protein BB560_005611 [Smittium megazygosporum]
MQAAPVRKVSSLYLLTRYAVFGFGIGYGFFHNRTLRAESAKKHEHDAYMKKVHLIEQAKLAYQEKIRPPTTSVNANFDDPNFDFEAWAKTLQ